MARSLSQLKWLRDQIGPRLKLCLDLCHLHVDQYDLATDAGRKQLLLDIDELGAESIAAIHVSDSHEKHGGTKDEHAE